ncbi:hypothetical protein MRX96_044435 [Rhipicephalus microplus]
MASGTHKRVACWDPPGQPNEIPVKRMFLAPPPTPPTVAPKVDILDSTPLERRREHYMGTPSPFSTTAGEINPSPCSNMTAPMPPRGASCKTTDVVWIKRRPKIQECAPDGSPFDIHQPMVMGGLR